MTGAHRNIILETRRLRLREFEDSPADLESLLALDSDPDVMRYIGDGATCNREQIQTAIRRVCAYYGENPGLGIWHAERKDTGAFMGWACLKHLGETGLIEAGYRLMKAQWNQGFATEAARALVDHGFRSLALAKIVAITHPLNLASQRVLEKVGFLRNGSLRFNERECAFFEISAGEATIT